MQRSKGQTAFHIVSDGACKIKYEGAIDAECLNCQHFGDSRALTILAAIKYAVQC